MCLDVVWVCILSSRYFDCIVNCTKWNACVRWVRVLALNCEYHCRLACGCFFIFLFVVVVVSVVFFAHELRVELSSARLCVAWHDRRVVRIESSIAHTYIFIPLKWMRNCNTITHLLQLQIMLLMMTGHKGTVVNLSFSLWPNIIIR